MNKWNREHLLAHGVEAHHRYVAYQGEAPLGFGATPDEALQDALDEHARVQGVGDAEPDEFEIAEIV
jgi:hypothetical protein